MSAGAQGKAGSPVSYVWKRDQDTPKPNWPAIDSIVQSVNKYLLSGYGVPRHWVAAKRPEQSGSSSWAGRWTVTRKILHVVINGDNCSEENKQGYMTGMQDGVLL